MTATGSIERVMGPATVASTTNPQQKNAVKLVLRLLVQMV